MSQLNPIFKSIIDAAFPTLNQPAEAEFTPCESCGAPSTHDEFDPGDPSVGYGAAWVPLCDDCGRRSR